MTVKYGKREEEVEFVEEVTCNRCGKTCRSDSDNIEALWISEVWGYDSPWDCQSWKANLCIECSKKFELWLKEAGGKIDKYEETLTGEIIGELEEN